jgi:hypothetical protein
LNSRSVKRERFGWGNSTVVTVSKNVSGGVEKVMGRVVVVLGLTQSQN